MLKKIVPYIPHIKSIGAGLVLALSFAPFNISVFAFVAPALLLWVLSDTSPKKAAIYGYLFGLGLFGFGASWIFHSIHVFGNASVILAGIITGLFVVTLALFPALKTWALVKYFPKDNLNRMMLAFPVIWVLVDFVRGWLLTGFPWLYIGNSQTGTIMRGFATIGGVWLVSWAVMLFSGLLYRFYLYIHYHERNPKKRNIILVSLLVIWPIAYVLDDVHWTKPADANIPVTLVQGNVPQLMRWDPAAANDIILKYAQLTKEHWTTQLVIWPEAAIPVPLPQSQSLLEQMQEIAQENNTAIIVGLPEQSADNSEQYYNSVVALGAASGTYRKQHLVPFGEYVPLEAILRGLIDFFNLPMSQFVPFEGDQAPIQVYGYNLGSAICYEIAYPNLVRNRAQNSHALLTVSNDAWFGRTFGPPQHLQIAQMRAVETGRYIIRATNNGITAIIQPDGQIQSMTPQFTATTLTGQITPMQGKTPWMWLGFLPWMAFYLLVIGLGYWRQHIQAKKK